ncbi:MAG: hypothetical protein ACI8UO_002826 [Verrucomicrobiales bacterium]|jgi:hypothetical protein
MSRSATILLMIAAVSLFFGLAWTNLFWDTPYEPVLKALALDQVQEINVARGVGGFLLLCGLITMIWRPAWLSATALILSLVPIGFFVAGTVMLATSERDQIAILASSAALICAPLVLLIAARFGLRGFGIFLTRVTLTLSFATFALLAFGETWPVEIPKFGEFVVGLPRPDSWMAALSNPQLPQLSESHQQLLWWCIAGAAVAGSLGIWLRIVTAPASLALCILALSGITMIVIANVDFGKPLAAQFHRWAPAAIVHLPLAILPIALWQMVWPAAEERKRRKLKQVEAVPPSAGRALPKKKAAKPEPEEQQKPKRELKRVEPAPVDAEPEPEEQQKPERKLKRVETTPVDADAEPEPPNEPEEQPVRKKLKRIE